MTYGEMMQKRRALIEEAKTFKPEIKDEMLMALLDIMADSQGFDRLNGFVSFWRAENSTDCQLT